MPYLKGIAGAGKGTIVNEVAGRFYDPIDVGVLSNNCERQFGISAFHDKILFVAGEIKNDLKMDQTAVSLSLSALNSPLIAGCMGGLTRVHSRVMALSACQPRRKLSTWPVTWTVMAA